MTIFWAWVVAIITVSAITEIIISGSIFDSFRDKLFAAANEDDSGKLIKFIDALLSCGYCFSVWVAIFVAPWVPGVITGYLAVDIILKVFTIHRLSNVFHILVQFLTTSVDILKAKRAQVEFDHGQTLDKGEGEQSS